MTVIARTLCNYKNQDHKYNVVKANLLMHNCALHTIKLIHFSIVVACVVITHIHIIHHMQLYTYIHIALIAFIFSFSLQVGGETIKYAVWETRCHHTHNVVIIG